MDKAKLSKIYGLGRAALNQREFTAGELEALADVPSAMVHTFIDDLKGHELSARPISDEPDSPILYQLTDKTVEYLIGKNLEAARAIRMLDATSGLSDSPAGLHRDL
jgi:hypothetical protein